MAFGGNFDEGEEVMSEINMTPLVDVMLVLLIIFIITVPVLTQTVNIDLPRAEATPNEAKPNIVNLAVHADGQVHWNETPIDADELTRRLEAAAGEAQQPEIHIRGARDADYEHVIKVMAAAQRAGVHKLGFVTEPGD